MMKKITSYLVVFILGGLILSVAYVMADNFGYHKHKSADIIDSSGTKVDTSRFPHKDGTETISGAWTHSGTTNLSGAFQINGTAVTATATEMNLLSGQTSLGDVSLTDSNTFSGTNNFTSTFQLGGVAVTSTAAEINLLDGVTALGDASLTATNTFSATNNFTGTFQIGTVTVSSTATELNLLDGSSFAGGVNTCPTNFSRVGPAFGRASFCITSAEQTAAGFIAAADACADIDTGSQGDGHLCTAIEWHIACTEGEDTGETDISNMTNGWEWVFDLQATAAGTQLGNTACTDDSQGGHNNSNPYRCCFASRTY